jgi:spore germination protein YaaH
MVTRRSLPCGLQLAGVAALLAASVLNPIPALAAGSSHPEPTHPQVMQQAAAQVAGAKHGTLKPFRAAAPLAAAAATPTPPNREVFGFALASSLNDPTVGDPTWNFSLLSTVAFFGLHVNNDGTFASDSGATVWNSSELTDLLNLAHAAGTKVVLTIIEQDFSAGTPNMCAALAHYSTTVTNTVAEVKAKGVDGVNVDYEGLNGSCGQSDPSWARHTLTSFVAALRAALPAGSYLSIDTYASSATDSAGFFDIGGLAPSVDSFFVMAYDLEYSNYARAPLSCSSFCLGPTAPLTGYYYNDTSTMSQYLSKVAASKVILGVPYYGRKACVGSLSPNQYPTGAVTADTYLDATGERTSSLVQPGTYAMNRDTHDATGQERWDTWYNTSLGCNRELYWDDTTSLSHKYALVNSDGLRGVGFWNLNYGGGAPELWCLISGYFTTAGYGGLPVVADVVPTSGPGTGGTTVTITGCGLSGATGVKFGGTAAASFTQVSDTEITAVSPAGATGTVDVTVTTPGGTSATSAADQFTFLFTQFFNWFDRASPGMVSDNIHLLDAGGSAANVTVSLPGAPALHVALAAGSETHVTFPAGKIGGPVTVTSDQPILASQRVQYYQSFNEVWAMSPSQAATTLYLPWFDRATPGMVGDNIHILNPGVVSTSGTVALPGATPIPFTLGGGQETHVSFPAGKIGGPVVITATQPVLAAQRVQYYKSFNEEVARPASAAASASSFQWFDRATPGMVGDNIHIVNPGGSTATGTVSLAGAPTQSFSIPAGGEVHVTFPAGHLGGPVMVQSSQPVLASQRVQYFKSFNEVPSAAPAQAQMTSHVMWFDRASPGMVADNIHVLNTSGSTATGTITLPGATSMPFSLAPGEEGHFTFPAGKLGGPVTITSNQPVLAAQRVQYYQSFNEVSTH